MSSFKTSSQSQLSQQTAKNSEIVTSAVRIINSGTGIGPTITSIIITDNNYINLDDTAVGTSNSFIKIIGSGFSTDANVFVSGTQVPVANVTFTNSGELRVALPILTVGTNNSVSVFNTTGVGAVASSSLFCSGFPIFTTSSYTSSTQTVNVQLLATGDGPLTYTLKSGSSLPTGLTLNTNGLISGTVTVDQTALFTVLVDDAQNQTVQQDITLLISSTDSYFNNTTLLVQADNAANNSNNGSVVDSSNNYNLVASTGTPIQGSINPFGQGWSNSFNGTNQYISASANAAFQFGTGDFTVECWVYKPAAANSPIIDARGSAVASPWALYVDGSNFPYFYDGTSYTSTLAITNNQWNHIAVVRTLGTLKIFVNGTQGYSGSHSTSLSPSATVYIGGQNFSSPAYTNGYISNLRVVKGTALYTTTFTPSNTPLTAVANTSLLTCQSNRFVDNSTNAFTITPTNSPTVERFNAFDVNANSYTVSANTFVGSTNFNGSTDYLTIPTNAAFQFGTGNFTVEAWVYVTSYAPNGSLGSYGGLIGAWVYGGNSDYLMSIRGTGAVYVEINGANIGTTSTTVPLNTWTHIALTRNSTSLQLFINGVSSLSATNSANIGTTYATTINGSSNQGNGTFFAGYISNVRVVKGTAVYTSTFTPSVIPLTAIAGTSLLTCQNSQVITDESTNKHSITKTGTPQQTLKNPFALTDTSTANTIYSGSYYFNGSSDYLSTPINTSLQFGTGNFTVECWHYLTSKATAQPCIFSNYNNFTTGALSLFAGHGSSSTTLYQVAINGTFPAIQSTTTISYNTWVHLAVVRNAGIVTLYINGVANGTVNASAASLNGVGSSFTVGVSGDNIAATYINGYISNFRVVKGTAVYTGAFTPLTAPLQPISNTSLLLSGTNSGIYDQTLQNNIRGSGGSVNTNVFKYGTGSMFFNGTSDFLQIGTTPGPITPLLTAGAVMTIEAWVYPTSLRAGGFVYTQPAILCLGATYMNFGVNNGVPTLYWYSGSSSSLASSISITTNTWSHLAVVINGTGSSNLKIYVNGVLGGTGTFVNISWSSILDGNSLYIGKEGGGTTSWWPGYIDELRITRSARYTANFTPPTNAFSSKSR